MRVTEGRRAARDRVARQPAWRTARGVTLAAISVGVSSAAHAAAGGHVQPLVLAIAIAATAAGFTALSDREWTLPRLVPTLAAGQALLHLLLLAAGPHQTGQVPVPTDHGMPAGGHLHGGAVLGDAPAVAGGADHGGLAMIAMHAAALVLIAVLLRGGEDLLLRTACALAAPLLRVFRLRLVPAPGADLRVPAGRPCAGCRPQWLQHSVGRRGPPRLVAC